MLNYSQIHLPVRPPPPLFSCFSVALLGRLLMLLVADVASCCCLLQVASCCRLLSALMHGHDTGPGESGLWVLGSGSGEPLLLACRSLHIDLLGIMEIM